LKLAVRQLGYGIDTTNHSRAPKGKGGCCG
jgi:hypothetical protein